MKAVKATNVCVLLLMVLACCAGTAYLIFFQPLGKYRKQSDDVIQQSKQLYNLVYMMLSDGEPPPQSIRDVIEYAKRERQSLKAIGAINSPPQGDSSPMPAKAWLARLKTQALAGSGRLTGLDPWGTPYHIETTPDLRNPVGKGCYLVVIRSYGPNKIDDFGSGDDRQHPMMHCRIPNLMFPEDYK